MLFLDSCEGLLEVVIIIRRVYNILQILIPIGLILFGLIDLGKDVIAGKEDEMKKAQKTLLMRVIYAVAVFLIFTLVSFAIGLLGSGNNSNTTGWKNCWNEAGSHISGGGSDEVEGN